MYQCGSLVVYGIHGVCRILDVEQRLIDRKKVEYFVLSPLDQLEARFYVPTHNLAALAKLRPLLTREELESLLHKECSASCQWISDENQRKLKYRELINRADTAELISMIRALHIHRQEQLAAKKKFHLCDENFLRDAEKLLISEISIVLNIPHEDVRAYFESEIDH